MTLPFEIQDVDLSDEDYRALSEYYSQPYYHRDASSVSHIKQYPGVVTSKSYKEEQIENIIAYAEKHHLSLQQAIVILSAAETPDD